MRLRSCCLAALAAAAHAAVAGAPEPGPAGALPLASLTTSNDMFGNGLGNADDFRTAAIGGHVRLDHVVLAVDGSMLTDRAASTRSDELLAIAGWAWGQQTPATGWQHSGFIGAGIRVDGDLFGQDVQNSVHDSIGADQVFLTYDGTTRVRAAVAGSAAAGWLGQAGLGLTGWWGMQLVVAGQSAVDGEVICEIGPRLALVGRQGALWVGPRLHFREGQPAGSTAAATGANEDGWWIESGTFVTPFGEGAASWGYQVRAAYSPSSRSAWGAVGVVVRPHASPAGAELALEHDLAIYRGGGFGVQLRWYPWPYQDTGRRSGAVLDYRFGTDPDGTLQPNQIIGSTPVGAEIRHDQITLGWEEGFRSPDWSGMRFVPWVQAAAGVRQEGEMISGSGARTLAGSVTTLVARGAFGVRLVMGERFSLGGSIDGWLPAWSEELRSYGDPITLNDPGWTFGLHLAAHISW